MLGIYESRANRELKKFLFRQRVRKSYASVRSWLNRTVSVLVISHDTAEPPRALAMKIKTLLFVVGFSVSVIVGGAVSLSANRILRTSLQKEQDLHQEAVQSYDELRDTLNGYLVDLRRYSEQINATLVDVAPAIPVSDLPDFHDTSEIAQLSAARTLLKKDLAVTTQLNSFFATTKPFLFSIPSLWPIKSGAGMITMPFGINLHPFTGKPYLHSGTDITTFRPGEPIVATADGRVDYAGYATDLGNYVVISHAFGFYTVYGHFQNIAVRTGMKVKRGQVIGFMGNTGLSTGPHLHYEVRNRGETLDPSAYLAVGRTSSAIADLPTNYKTAIGGSYESSGAASSPGSSK